MSNTNNPIELLVSISADTAGSKASLQEQLRKLSAELKGLELGVTIDDNAFKKTSNTLEETNSQFVKLVRTSDSFTASFNKLGSESDVMAKRVTSSFKEMSTESTKSIEEIKKQFKDQGKDFTVKTDIDIEDGQKILKGLQVDVKQTEDSIERITYKLKDMGAGGGTELVQDSIKNIDSAAFNLSKNLNDATSKLTLLHQEGKISTESFNELSKKANELGTSSGFKDLGNDIKQATLDQKQLTEEMKQQEAIQSKIGETVNKRSESVAKEEEAQARAINKTLDDQYKKYESINAKLDEHVSKLRLTQEQASKMASGISPTMSIDKLNDQERAMNKQVETNKVLNRELKEQEKLQERIRKLINSIVTEQGKNPKAFGNSPEVSEMLNTLNKIDPASKGAAESVKGVSNSFDRMKAEAQSAGRESMGVMESFRIAMEKFPVWMAASTVFYGTVRSIKSALSEIVEIDSQQTILKRVAGDGVDANQVLQESVRIAGELGNAISDVNEGFIAFARQGYRGDELTYLSEYATLLGNISDLSVEDASSVLTAGMKGFGIEAENVTRIVDSLNEVDNNYSITTQQLAEAMQRSAGAASTYGIELEKNIGYTTAIGQVTRESGSVIGNSLKSIYSRITSIQPAIDAMADIGIGIKDASGEMRDVSDILDDLGAKWQDLSAEQQQNLGLQIAGRFQLSRFLILMEQYDEALDSTNTALNSAGSGYRENAEYLKSFEAQINMVKNAWTETVLAMRDGGLGDSMVLGLSVGLEFFKVITKIIDTIGVFPTVLGAGSVALLLFSDRSRTASLSLSAGLIPSIQSIPLVGGRAVSSLSAMSIGLQRLTAGSAVATASLGALRTVISFAWPIAAIMAVGAAISAVTSKIVEQKTMQEELMRSLENTQDTNIDAITRNKEQVDSLISSYEQLNDKRDNEGLNVEENERYLAVQQELSELFPSLIDYVDSKGVAHLKTSEGIQEEISATERLLDLRRQEAIIEAKDTYKESLERLDSINDQIASAEKRLQSAENTIQNSLTEDTRKKAEDNAEKYRFQISQLKTLHESLTGSLSADVNDVSNAFLAMAGVIDEIAVSVGRINNEIDFTGMNPEEIESVRLKIDNLGASMGKAFESGNVEEYNKKVKELSSFLEGLGVDSSFIDSLKSGELSFANLTEEMERNEETAKLAAQALAESGESAEGAIDGVDGLGEAMEGAKIYMEGLEGTAYALKDTLEQLAGVSQQHIDDSDELLWMYETLAGQLALLTEGTVEYANVSGQLASTGEELATLYPHLADEAFSLLQTYENLIIQTEGAATVSDELWEAQAKLINLYPELEQTGINQISLTEAVIGAIAAEVEANDVLLAAMSASQKGKLTAEEEKTLSSLQNTNARIKQINSEITALNKLKDAYAAMSGANTAAIAAAEAVGNKFVADALRVANYGMEASVNSMIKASHAELATATAERTKYTNILSNSENVLSNATTRGNKARNDATKASKKAADAAKKNAEAQKDLNVEMKESIYLTDVYKNTLEKLNLELAKINNTKSKYPTWSAQYRKALDQEIDALQRKEKLLQAEQRYIQSQIKTGNVAKTGVITTTVGQTSGGTYTGKYATEINRAAQTYGVDANLIAAVIQAESNFNPNARSSAGAQGLMQLMPATARSLGVQNSYNASQNIMGGTKYLAQQLKAFSGDIKMALAAYNAGPGNVRKYGGIPPFRETQNYIKKVTDTLAKSNSVAVAQAAGANSAAYYLNNFRMTSGFGPRNTGIPGASTNHLGADFAAKAGTSIKSLRDGKVVASYYHNAQGHVVRIQQDDGIVAQYQHMQGKSPLKVGQAVKANQEVGRVGSTGVSSGPHLHLEIRQNGKHVDPIPYLKAQAENVSSASQLVAETHRDIDALQSELLKKEIEAIQNREAIDALVRERIESHLAEFEMRRQRQQRIIDYENEKIKSLDLSSRRYIDTLKLQIGSLGWKKKANEDELEYLNELIKSGSLSSNVLAEMRIRSEELTQEILALNNELKDLASVKIGVYMLEHQEAIDKLNYALQRSELITATLKEGTADYNHQVKVSIDLMKQEQEAVLAQRDHLQKLIMTQGMHLEDIKKHQKQIDELTLAYWTLVGQIDNANKSLEESNKTLAENIANDLINAYKEYIGEKRDMHMKSLDEEAKREDKRHKKVMDNYRDELDAFRKIIQERNEAIDREESERDYNKEIEKLEEERLEILSKINLLSLDDSLEAKAERKRLQEDLDNIDETIEEKRHKREVELRKENLNDILKDKEEEISEKEKLENKRHDAEVERIDKLRKYWEQFYTDQLNDERKFAEIKKQIVAGNFEALSKEFQDYINEMKITMPSLENTLDGTMQAVGTSIRKNIIENLQKALDMMKEFQTDTTTPSKPGGGGASGSDTGLEGEGKRTLNEADLKVLTGKFMTDILYDEGDTPYRKSEIRRKAHEIAASGRSEGSDIERNLGFDDAIADLSDADLYALGEYLSKTSYETVMLGKFQDFIRNFGMRLMGSAAHLETGGYTGNFKGGKMAVLHEKEVVFNKKETKNLFDKLPVLDKLNSLLNLRMPSVTPPALSGAGAGDTIEINFLVDKMVGSDKEAKSFMGETMREIRRRKGGH